LPKKINTFIASAIFGVLATNVCAAEVVLDVEFDPAAINNPKIIGARCGDGPTGCAKGKTVGYKWPKLTDHWDFDTWVRVKTGNKTVRVKLFNLDVRFGEHCVHSFDAHLAGEVYGCRRP
jgi:hypothetical protein